MDFFPEIPGYTIEKKIAEGRLSSVYLGVQEDLDRQVAIKVLHPDLLDDKKFTDSFHREAKKAPKFAHPNIVNIIDVGEYNGIYFIVTEHLTLSLRDRINQIHGEMDTPESGDEPDYGKSQSKVNGYELLHIVKQVAWAFGFAHKQGVVHKDIRPDNIRFRPDGTPVVVGFFISRVIGSLDTLKKRGMLAGAPSYVSPEQALRKLLDNRSDIYSLGVTLFEMLTGRVPYTADEAIAIENMHIMEPLPELPEEFRLYQPLLGSMMAKDKDDRVANGPELIKLIDEMTYKLPENRRTIPRPLILPDDPQKPLTDIPGEELEEEDEGILLTNSVDQEDDSKDKKNKKTKKNKKKEKKKKEKKKKKKKEGKKLSLPKISLPSFSMPSFDKDDLLDHLRNPKVLIGVGAVVVILVVLIFFMGGSSDEPGTKSADLTKIDSTPLTPEQQKELDQKYDYHFSRAKRFFKKKDYEKALIKAKAAQKVKKTPETEKMIKQITVDMVNKKDDDAYKKAVDTGTIDSFEAYLTQYPSGRHSKEAEDQLLQIKAEIKAEEERRATLLANSISLRSEPQDMSRAAVKEMLKQKSFFDKYYNKTGDFKNNYLLETVNGEKVVLDFATGLMWVHGGSANYMKHLKVEIWLDDFNDNQYAGYSDWRLPTLEEAVSLLEPSDAAGSLYIYKIFSREQQFIWTSDTLGNKLWAVDFFGGDVNPIAKTFDVYVRPVRSITTMQVDPTKKNTDTSEGAE